MYNGCNTLDRSGETVNIVSQRGTINRGGNRATTNIVHLIGIDVDELQDRTGVFRDTNGPGIAV